MIRMVIQEMEETLVEVRSGTAKVIAEKKTLTRRAEQLRKQAADWESKAELALSKGRGRLGKGRADGKIQHQRQCRNYREGSKKA